MVFLRAAGLGRRRALRAISPAKVSLRSVPVAVRRRSAWLYSGPIQLTVELSLPRPAEPCAGWVIVPGAGRQDASLTQVVSALQRAGFATLTVDLPGQNWTRNPAAALR